MFDLGRLKLLYELSQRETMTAVAIASRLTPSAVSQQLATLENEAQVKLFEPLGRRVRLTAAGLRLVSHARRILDAVEAARLDMGLASTHPSGRLELACFGTFAKSHALPAIVRAREKHGELHIVLRELEPVDALAAIRNGACDAAIIYTHSLVPHDVDDALVTHSLFEEEMVLALPQNLAHLPDPLELNELAEFEWIGGARESEGFTLTGRACAAAGFAPRITHSVDDYDLLLRMVGAGLGVSFVPRLALDLHPTPAIVVRTPAGVPLRRSFSLVARPIFSATPSFAALREELSARRHPPVSQREYASR